MTTPAERRLPKVVDMVGDRIGLDYSISRRETTESYVRQHDRLDLTNLKYSSYSLSEGKTKKSSGETLKANRIVDAKNPLKLNSRLRKMLYKLSPLDKQQLKYKTMKEIHQIWLQYSEKVLSTSGDASNIFRMDLHGCLLKCTASRNPTLVGAEGIVVQETKNTFLVICESDRVITLPKRESIFEFKIGDKLFRIHGCNLLFTVQARSKAKYKQQRSTSNV